MATIEQFDLAGQAYGGLVNEDVMQKIWDISNVPLPLTDRIGTDSHSNAFCEWTVDELAAPIKTNAYYDAQVTTGVASEKLGNRKGNRTQTSVKVVKVGTIAQAVDTIGFADALAYQISRRQIELKRDIEATMLSNQASVAEAASTPGTSAGLGAWITQSDDGTSTPGGWQSGTGLVSARTSAGDAGDRVMTESMVRAGMKTVYESGGESTIFMTTPSLVEQFSIYLFSSSARIASLQSDVRESTGGVVASASVRLFVGDFGTLEIVANRLQLTEGTTTCYNAYILDPMYLRLSYLKGFQVEPLAKDGLSDQRQMSVSWSLKVLNENAQYMLADIIYNGTVTT